MSTALEGKIMKIGLSEFYTLSELLALGIASRTSIWKWRKSGRLETYPLGRETLIRKADIERIRSEREVETI